MSFGFSISDIISVTQLARNVYKRCRDARGEYIDISRDVESLYLVMRKVKDEAERPESLLNRQENSQELNKLVGNCEEVLKQLNALVKKHGNLEKEKPGVWIRLRIPKGPDLAELRGKLTAQTAAISVFLETVGLGGIGLIEGKVDDIGTQLPEIKDTLNKIAADMRAGRREGSVMTTRTDDDKVVWREFRRELITEGFSSKIIGRFKEPIKAYIQNLAAQGLLDEEAVDSDSPSSLNGQSQPVTCTGCSASVAKCTCHDSTRSNNLPPSAPQPVDTFEIFLSMVHVYDEMKMLLERLTIVDHTLKECYRKMPAMLSLNDRIFALRTALRSYHAACGYPYLLSKGDESAVKVHLQELLQRCYTVLENVHTFANAYESLDTDEKRLDWSVSPSTEGLSNLVLTCTNDLHSWRRFASDHTHLSSLFSNQLDHHPWNHCTRLGCTRYNCFGHGAYQCASPSRAFPQQLCIEYVKLPPCDPTFFSSQIWMGVNFPPCDSTSFPSQLRMWDDCMREKEAWSLRRLLPNCVFYIDTLAQQDEDMCFWKPPIEEVDPCRPLPNGWKRIQGLTGQIRYRDNATGLMSYSHPSDNPWLTTNSDLHRKELKAISQEAPCQIARLIWCYPHIRKAIADKVFPELTVLEDIKQAIKDHWRARARSEGIWFWDGLLFKKCITSVQPNRRNYTVTKYCS